MGQTDVLDYWYGRPGGGVHGDLFHRGSDYDSARFGRFPFRIYLCATLSSVLRPNRHLNMTMAAAAMAASCLPTLYNDGRSRWTVKCTLHIKNGCSTTAPLIFLLPVDGMKIDVFKSGEKRNLQQSPSLTLPTGNDADCDSFVFFARGRRLNAAPGSGFWSPYLVAVLWNTFSVVGLFRPIRVRLGKQQFFRFLFRYVTVARRRTSFGVR